MLKSVEGVYRDGKVELTEFPGDVRDETRVIVTFLETSRIDLRACGIDEAQAAELRAQLGTFVEEWDSPDMALYDDHQPPVSCQPSEPCGGRGIDAHRATNWAPDRLGGHDR